ncbi:MAG TPA: bifunctional UDP-4-keto-pentose/UDP-xylose synthase, partial [Burkholderiales bacterium]|nr:bifunctional UDP-4-keto-pentose/UDP-xylose synthase [Burkholderiales bacterium]
KLVKTTAVQYYGRGYQDVQNRVPKIANTTKDLHWRPRVGMKQALKLIFDAYRDHVGEARRLMD